MNEVNLTWNSKMSFTCEIDGHQLEIDAKEENGGENKGPRPKPLLLSALGGCSGMDVVSILNKMHVNFDEFKIDVKGSLTEEHPKHYKELTIEYKFKGDNIPPDKVIKAVDLSLNKYCGVSYILKQALTINSIIIINGIVIN